MLSHSRRSRRKKPACPACGLEKRWHRKGGLVCRAECAANAARAKGLVRCGYPYDLTVVDMSNEALVRVEMLPTVVSGYGGKIAYECWTRNWVAKVANWPGEDRGTKIKAIRRLAGDAKMIAAFMASGFCEPAVQFDGFEIQLVVRGSYYLYNDKDSNVALLSLLGPRRAGEFSARSPFQIVFNSEGKITSLDPGVKLAWAVAAHEVVGKFARCNAVIRWLASEG